MSVRPRALQPGDRVAIVAPSSPIRDRAALDRGVERLRSWGLDPHVLPNCLANDGRYLAGSDAERAADLQTAIDDPQYRAVFCARGGYGVTRLLDHVTFDALAADPKPIVGYSDITALLAAIRRSVDLIGFHGPMVATTVTHEIGEDGIALQRDLLTTTDEPVELPAIASAERVETLRSGDASGPLVGGNLTLVNALLATPWQLDMRGALVFLEEVDERPYRVDRQLTQLRQAGCLEDCAGVLIGDFVGVAGREEDREILDEVLAERLGDLDVPVTRGWPFGHRPGSWTLPFGARARLRAEGDSPGITLLEPAVRSGD